MRTDLTDQIEKILRSRTYDRHAYDEETFEELLDEIDTLRQGEEMTARHEAYTPCPVCKGKTSHHRDCPRPVLGTPAVCRCDPAEVDRGICVKCGNPFQVGGAV
jgi:hypothetical protein